MIVLQNSTTTLYFDTEEQACNYLNCKPNDIEVALALQTKIKNWTVSEF